MQSRLGELAEIVNKRLEETEMFTDEKEALDYLVEQGRITDKEYWQNALKVVKNLNYLIIKWANDIKGN